MRLNFSKMHGLGNDFVILDGTNHTINLSATQIQQLGDRKYGVGFDQLLIVEPSDRADFYYRIFNANGSAAEQCGNGARCFADYLLRKGLSKNSDITLETSNGMIRVAKLGKDHYQVDMGVPVFEPERVPFKATQEELSYNLELANEIYTIGVVSMGNPHAVLFVDDVDVAPVVSLGPEIERHVRFPQRANVGFMQIIDKNTAKLRVWERDVGETRACGTGACAAMVIACQRGLLNETATLQLRGGDLQITWSGPDESVTMTGPASYVFEGSIEI